MDVNLHISLLIAIVVLDGILGDPVYGAHPIRLMGHTIHFFEKQLWALRLNGRWGGTLLTLLTLSVFVVPVWVIGDWLMSWTWVGWFIWSLYWGFHSFALRDLAEHVWRIGKAAQSGDLEKAHFATSRLVGRDTAPMNESDCCRAGLESLSENLTDGVIAPLFWFAIGGVPAMVAFKVVSTLDSMVGYKNERYFYFGWSGARLDDLLNWIPARLTWILTCIISFLTPGLSAKKAFLVGWTQHALAPGPNSGWSETAFAGALQRRLAGPIWKNGVLVTSLWLGHSQDSEHVNLSDIRRGIGLAIAVTLLFVLSILIILSFKFPFFEKLA